MPEPMMIVGNKSPDGDSVGCIAAILTFLRDAGLEAYAYFPIPPDSSLGWMIDESDTCRGIETEYQSLIVVDDFVDSERLGFEIRDVPIINVDHHGTNKPDNALINEITATVKNKTLQFWSDVPATACLLIAMGVFHPYLWISLWTDSVGFTVKNITVMKWLNYLVEGLKDSDSELTDEVQSWMYSKLNKIGSLQSFDVLMHSNVYAFAGMYKGQPIQVLLGIINSSNIEAGYKALGTFRAFSDVTCVISRTNGRVSLRSRLDDYNVQAIALKFGGGGHIKASGCKVNETDLNNEVDRMIDLLLENVTDHSSRIYM